MARLSKTNTEALIKFLLTKKDKKIKDEESVIKLTIETWVNRQLPNAIKEAYVNYPGYFKTTTIVQVSGFGFNYDHYSTHNLCPKTGPGSYFQLKLSEQQAKELRELKSKFDKLEKERKVLKTDLETLIYSLGSPKKIMENIPESQGFLQVLLSSSTVPVVSTDITSILNRLKQ